MSKISFDPSISFIDNLKMNGVTFEDYNEAVTFVASAGPTKILDMLANSSLDDENKTIRMDEGRFEELSDMAGGSKTTRRILATIYIVASTLIMWFLDQQRREYTHQRAELLEPGVINGLLNWAGRDTALIRNEIAVYNNMFSTFIIIYVFSILYASLVHVFNIISNERLLSAAGTMFPILVGAIAPGQNLQATALYGAINTALTSEATQKFARSYDQSLQAQNAQDDEAKRARAEEARAEKAARAEEARALAAERAARAEEDKLRAEEARLALSKISGIKSQQSFIGGLKRKTKSARKNKSRHSTKRYRK